MWNGVEWGLRNGFCICFRLWHEIHLKFIFSSFDKINWQNIIPPNLFPTCVLSMLNPQLDQILAQPLLECFRSSRKQGKYKIIFTVRQTNVVWCIFPHCSSIVCEGYFLDNVIPSFKLEAYYVNIWVFGDKRWMAKAASYNLWCLLLWSYHIYSVQGVCGNSKGLIQLNRKQMRC